MAAILSPPPDQSPRFASSLRSTPALRGFGYRLRPRTVPAVSPAFGRRRPAKPGDPPPPSRPAAAEASDRNRSLSRPHTGASLAKETVMIIGNFTYSKAQDTYTGELATLEVGARKVVFRPNEAKTDKAPNYRVIGLSKTGDVEFGAAWQK